MLVEPCQTLQTFTQIRQLPYIYIIMFGTSILLFPHSKMVKSSRSSVKSPWPPAAWKLLRGCHKKCLCHKKTSEPFGISQSICTRTLRNLVRNLVLKLHRIAPELIWAKDPITKFCCWGKIWLYHPNGMKSGGTVKMEVKPAISRGLKRQNS